MRNLFRSVALALTAVTLLGGCISARPYTLLKYDRQTDTFHELRIYTDIAGADNLSQNFRQRDRYIPTVCVGTQGDRRWRGAGVTGTERLCVSLRSSGSGTTTIA